LLSSFRWRKLPLRVVTHGIDGSVPDRQCGVVHPPWSPPAEVLGSWV
jgi:hypothetical protein